MKIRLIRRQGDIYSSLDALVQAIHFKNQRKIFTNLVFCKYRGIWCNVIVLGMINVPPSCYNNILNKYFGDENLVHAVFKRFAATFYLNRHTRDADAVKNKVKN